MQTLAFTITLSLMVSNFALETSPAETRFSAPASFHINDSSRPLEGIPHPVFVSDNAGQSWTIQEVLLPITGSITSIVASAQKVYVGTKNNGIYVSVDHKKTWTPVNEGITDLHVRALAAEDQQLLAGTDAKGVFWSTDGGNSWRAVNGNLPDFLQVFSVAIHANTWLIGTNRGLYASWNKGKNWLQIHDSDGHTIIVDKFHFLVSTMQSELLRFPLIGWPAQPVEPEVPAGLEVIHSLISVGTVVLAGSPEQGIWMSYDQGRSWKRSVEGWPVLSSITGLYQEGEKIYAFTSPTMEGSGC